MFVHALGIHYLWIDSYCIIQDSPVDWDAEAKQMAAIFENSYLTVPATASANNNAGCFWEANSSQGRPLSKCRCRILGAAAALNTKGDATLGENPDFKSRNFLSASYKGLGISGANPSSSSNTFQPSRIGLGMRGMVSASAATSTSVRMRRMLDGRRRNLGVRLLNCTPH